MEGAAQLSSRVVARQKFEACAARASPLFFSTEAGNLNFYIKSSSLKILAPLDKIRSLLCKSNRTRLPCPPGATKTQLSSPCCLPLGAACVLEGPGPWSQLTRV